MAKHELPPSTANPVRVVRVGGNNNIPPGAVPPGTAADPYVPNPDLEQYGYQTGLNGERNYDVNVGMTGGLMDTISAIGDSRYANNNYNIAPARATNREVQQNELSQYQLQQMLASNSPLMRQQAAQGMARGGSRGLMNSSLSVGAAQGAMISGAQPFALQDSAWYGRTAADNMQATNAIAKANLDSRGLTMQAKSARDRQILAQQLSGYGDIRKAMIGIEDREDVQDYNAWQNDTNRAWTSNENMLTNSLTWAQTKLDAGLRLKMSREQAFAQIMSDIGGIENQKISATQRGNAIRDAMATLQQVYKDVPPGIFETSYDPATGISTDAQGNIIQPPDTTVPGTESVVTGGTTVVTNPDGSTNITIKSSDPEVEEAFNALADV